MKCMFHIHTVYSGDGRITLPEYPQHALFRETWLYTPQFIHQAH